MATPEKFTYPNNKSAYSSCGGTGGPTGRYGGVVRDALHVAPLVDRTLRSARSARPGKIQHQLTVVHVYGVMLFLWQCASRRAGNRELTQPAVWETLQAPFPELNTIPHMDTVARVLERLPAELLESILLETGKRLLRNRRLASWMVQQHYLVAVDGTLKWSAAYSKRP